MKGINNKALTSIGGKQKGYNHENAKMVWSRPYFPGGNWAIA